MKWLVKWFCGGGRRAHGHTAAVSEDLRWDGARFRRRGGGLFGRVLRVLPGLATGYFAGCYFAALAAFGLRGLDTFVESVVLPSTAM